MTIDSSEEKLARYLFSLRRFGIRLGLENITRLLQVLQNPQCSFKAIHVAGTNGKGSTGAMMASIFQKAGYKTGLYVSPHLFSFRERIRVNGEWIFLSAVQTYLKKIRTTIDTYHCTFFEVMTAIAFAYFADQGVEYAIVETGLGGRLDATNVLNPVASVITEIDLDHTETLGGNVRDIAREKAGIIKPNTPVITSAHNHEAIDVFNEICRERESTLYPVVQECRYKDRIISPEKMEFTVQTPLNLYSSISLRLLGVHQIWNAVTAIRTAELLEGGDSKINGESIKKGLAETYWPGRFEIYSGNPTIILDVAHNPNGMTQLVKTFRLVFHQKKFVLMMGVLADKDFESMIDNVVPQAKEVIAVQPNNPRALTSSKLAEEIQKRNVPVQAAGTVKMGFAVFRKRARDDDILVITGSSYSVSDALLELVKM
ncbi:folylpolyglutamate synthase [bacterium BMS3Abin05]|nr:folylpolyglutamate synthase [bacterium BMS3Abin05]GBE26487.1 folylpolyglutamate synthase [bacterium BMS3Bbin03]